MDPFSCYLRFIDAINANDFDEMMSAVEDLDDWCYKGGDPKAEATRITANGWKALRALFLKITDQQKILTKLALCLDENDQHQGTHYIRDGKIEPKGSFIELVHKAQGMLPEPEEEPKTYRIVRKFFDKHPSQLYS